MTPLIDDRVEAIGSEVRELARLHGELARTELRHGCIRLVAGLLLLGFGVAAGLLVIVFAGVACILFLAPRFGTAGATAVVTLVDAFVAGIAIWFGIRALRGASSLFMPRTRTLLGELLPWRDPPTNS